MKLHWSPSAPFVRKVLICAEELGLTERITCVRASVGPTRVNPELLADNPLNKVPTLVLDNGEALYDSRVICEYLDHLAGGGQLYPDDPSKRFSALRRQVLADGLLDVAILKRDEDLRVGHESQAHQLAFATKIASAFDQMEKESATMDAGSYDIGHIAFGCALSYFDFRFADYGWREARPHLTALCYLFDARSASRAHPYSSEPGRSFPLYRFDDPAMPAS